jgi:hypothetical protein
MIPEFEQKKFNKLIDKIGPRLSLLQNDGVSIDEAKSKLKDLFEDARGKSYIDRIYWAINIFERWLKDEKQLSAERAAEMTRPLHSAFGQLLGESNGEQEIEKETKVLPFRKIR